MDPSSSYAMRRLLELKDRFDIAFACDTDHDRHGIVTRNAGLLPPNHYLSVAIDYLFQHRPQWRKDAAVGKTIVSTPDDRSRRPRSSAASSTKCRSDSNGLSTGCSTARSASAAKRAPAPPFCAATAAVWTTDKDGIVPALLAAEITARMGRDPGEIYRELAREFGEPVGDRVEARRRRTEEMLAGLSPQQDRDTELAGETISSILEPRAGQRRSDRRAQGDRQEWMVRRASIGHRGHLQDLWRRASVAGLICGASWKKRRRSSTGRSLGWPASAGLKRDETPWSNRTVDAELEWLQRAKLSAYFLHETQSAQWARRSTRPRRDGPPSIAAIGFALWRAIRSASSAASLRALRRSSERSPRCDFSGTARKAPSADATGYRGYYYHFLDMQTGRRAWQCELSTDGQPHSAGRRVDRRRIFRRGYDGPRTEIRALADALYRRADWTWAQNGGATVTHGWKPESGFLQCGGKATTRRSCSMSSVSARPPIRCRREQLRGVGLRPTSGNTVTDTTISTPALSSSTRFSHLWVDFRGIPDAFMREKGIDYFENSRRATYVQQRVRDRQPAHVCEGYGRLLGHYGE